MKKVLVAFLAGFLVFGANFAFSAESNEPGVKSALSPEDMQKLRRDLESLAQVMGLEIKEQDQNVAPRNDTQSANRKKHSTIAAVLDKALDISSAYVASIAETLKKVAPELWRIMIRQQYANAVSFLVVPWGLIFLGMILYYAIGKLISEGNANYDAMNPQAWRVVGRSAVFIVSSIVSVIAVFQSVTAVKILMNPEYYAIKDMLAILLGRGGL